MAGELHRQTCDARKRGRGLNDRYIEQDQDQTTLLADEPREAGVMPWTCQVHGMTQHWCRDDYGTTEE